MSSPSFWGDSLFLTSDEVTSDELEANEDAIVTEIDDDSGYKGIDLSVVLCYTNHVSRPTPYEKHGAFSHQLHRFTDGQASKSV